MAYANGIITAPVSIADIQAVLGTPASDVGTLCTLDKKINKWSRRKPVACYPLFRVTEADMVDVSYGLSVPVLAGPFESCIQKIVNGDESTKWGYVTPKGGRNSPYRMTDFENYYHNATPPFPYRTGDVKFNVADDKMKIYFDFPVDEADPDVVGIDSYNVKLSEIKFSPGLVNNLGEFKLAIAVKQDNSPTVGAKRYLSEKTLEEGGHSVTVESAGLSAGFDYTCYPFFYKEQGDSFLVVPSDGMSFKMHCYKNGSGDLGGDDTKKTFTFNLSYVNGVPTGTIKISNLTTSQIILTNIEVTFVRYVDDAPVTQGVWIPYTGAWPIAANGSVTLNIPSDGYWKDLKVPEKDIENVTYAQLTATSSKGSGVVVSDTEEVW